MHLVLVDGGGGGGLVHGAYIHELVARGADAGSPRVLRASFRGLGLACRVSSIGYRVQGIGYRV